MTIAEAKKQVIQALANLYDQREANNISTILLEKVTGLTALQQVLQKNEQLNQLAQEHFTISLAKLKEGEPIQYVIGEAWFSGFLFAVSQATLIPRPETEELVQWVIDDFTDSEKDINLLDIGTGTGCIPISIGKKITAKKIYALDISLDALSIAQKNASSIGVNVEILHSNFLDSSIWNSLPEINIITSNPPYIAEAEKATMHKNVLDHEPHVALFVPDTDPLIFYKAIANYAEKKLVAGSHIYLELNENLGKETEAVFEELHFDTLLKKDMQGKMRFLRAIKK